MADHYGSYLTDDVRKAIFAALVEMQDQKVPTGASRQRAADQFRIPYNLVTEIEAEGMEKEWPPLGDG